MLEKKQKVLEKRVAAEMQARSIPRPRTREVV